jgi:hypothetical protein
LSRETQKSIMPWSVTTFPWMEEEKTLKQSEKSVSLSSFKSELPRTQSRNSYLECFVRVYKQSFIYTTKALGYGDWREPVGAYFKFLWLHSCESNVKICGNFRGRVPLGIPAWYLQLVQFASLGARCVLWLDVPKIKDMFLFWILIVVLWNNCFPSTIRFIL